MYTLANTLLPSLQLNIHNFNFDNNQNLIDLDYE